MRKWIETPNVPGPDFSSLMKGMETNVWEKEEELSLMSLAIWLLTDWTTTTAIDQLTKQLAKLGGHINHITESLLKLQGEGNQLTTLSPDNKEQLFIERFPPTRAQGLGVSNNPTRSQMDPISTNKQPDLSKNGEPTGSLRF